MNKLTIIGNLTRDPELRSVTTANGPVSVCDFTVAVNSRRRGGQNNNGQQPQGQMPSGGMNSAPQALANNQA